MNKNKFCEEPVNLSLERNYYLNVIKEITVTDSFLSMDKGTTKCQDYEPYDDCKTKNYINNLVNKCQCLPFQIRFHNHEV